MTNNIKSIDSYNQLAWSKTAGYYTVELNWFERLLKLLPDCLLKLTEWGIRIAEAKFENVIQGKWTSAANLDQNVINKVAVIYLKKFGVVPAGYKIAVELNEVTSSEVTAKGIGIRNIGNSCYLNSMMQTIVNNEHWIKEIRSTGKTKSQKVLDTLHDFLQDKIDQKTCETLLRNILEGDVLGQEAYSVLNLLSPILERNIFTPEKTASLTESLIFIKIELKQQVLNTQVSKPQEMLETLKLFIDCYKAEYPELHELVKSIRTQFHRYDPNIFVSSISSQQDAFEFLNMLLDMLEMNSFKLLDTTSMGRKEVPVRFLDVEIADKRSVQLEDCLDQFFAEEEIEDIHGKMIKKQFKIEDFPPVLPIRLKRFDNQQRLNAKDVTLPEILDLSKYAVREGHPPIQYRLKSVINHRGASLRSGHYVAHSIIDGKCKLFDDGNPVADVDPSVLRKGYVFIYERVSDTTPIELPKPMENDGALCYLNVLLQSFRAMPTLQNHETLHTIDSKTLREKLGYDATSHQNVQEVATLVLDHFKIERLRNPRTQTPIMVVPTPTLSLQEGIRTNLLKRGLEKFPSIIPVIIGDPKEVDLNEPLTLGQSNYQLRSGIIHIKNHYIAIVKKEDKWFKCNDTHIEELTEERARAEIQKATTFFFEKT